MVTVCQGNWQRGNRDDVIAVVWGGEVLCSGVHYCKEECLVEFNKVLLVKCSLVKYSAVLQ